MKISLTPLDKLASEFVRKRSKGFCERCGKYYGWEKLQCCHYHGRRKRNTRWDESNLVALDFGCHQYFHENPREFSDFMLERLGEQEFDNLNIRARIYGKVDLGLWELYLKAKLCDAKG